MSGLIHHLSISQSHVFLINSRLGLFTAANRSWRPFSRSYGAILPSSLAMIHSSTFGYSPRLPVSVCGTGNYYLKLSRFSWEPGYRNYPFVRRLLVLSGSAQNTDLPAFRIPTPFNELFRQFAYVSLLRHCIAVIVCTGILTCYPSNFPFGYFLGPD